MSLATLAAIVILAGVLGVILAVSIITVAIPHPKLPRKG